MSLSHPSLKLLVCSHSHHALFAEQEVVVVVYVWSHSKFTTHMVDVALLEHAYLEVEVMLWPAMDHKGWDVLHVGPWTPSATGLQTSRSWFHPVSRVASSLGGWSSRLLPIATPPAPCAMGFASPWRAKSSLLLWFPWTARSGDPKAAGLAWWSHGLHRPQGAATHELELHLAQLMLAQPGEVPGDEKALLQQGVMGSLQTLDMGITSNTTSLAVADSLGWIIFYCLTALSWICDVCDAPAFPGRPVEHRSIRCRTRAKGAPRSQVLQVVLCGTVGHFRITGAQVVVIAVLIAAYASVGNPWSHTTQTSLTEEVQENLNWSEPISRDWETPSKTENKQRTNKEHIQRSVHPTRHAAWETNVVQKKKRQTCKFHWIQAHLTNKPPPGLQHIHDPNQLFAAANHTTSPTNHTNLLTFPTQTQIKKIGREKTEKPRRICFRPICILYIIY